MPSHSLLATLGSCLLLLSSTAAAQRAALPVGDLLSPSLRSGPLLDDGWISHLPCRTDGDSQELRIRGEEQLLSRDENGAQADYVYLSGDDLKAIVVSLVEVDKSAVEVFPESGTLLVPAAAADATRATLAWIRSKLPPRIDLTYQLDLLDGDAVTPLLHGSDSLVNGALTVASDTTSTSALASFDVEIADGTTIANPRVFDVRTGASLALRARVIPGREAAVVEGVARVATPRSSGVIQTGYAGFSYLERVSAHIAECGMSARVGRGQTTEHTWTSQAGQRLRLRCTVDWHPSADAGATARGLLCGALLNRPVLGFASRAALAQAPAPLHRSIGRIVDAMFERHDQGLIHWGHSDRYAVGMLVVRGTEAEADEQELMGRIDRALQARDLSIEVRTVPVAAGAAESGKVVLAARGNAIAGIPICFASANEQTYLRDWDCEVAMSTRIPVPRIAVAADGYAITARVEVDADGRPSGVVRQCRLRRLDGSDSITTAIDQEQTNPDLVHSYGIRRGGAPAARRTPAARLPQDTVSIEKPRTRELAFSTRIALDGAGQGSTRRTATAYAGQPIQLLLDVHVQ